MQPRLYGTARSHFARIVRVLGLELGIEFDWVDVGNVADAELFGGNPLMQVPALDDGGRSVWGVQNICEYLVERAGKDPLGVRTSDWSETNLVYVVQGVMSAEVQLILAERAGMESRGGVFDKVRARLKNGLAFIEDHVGDEGPLRYSQVCVVSMWDHLRLYENASVADAPRIEAAVERLGRHASLAATRPR